MASVTGRINGIKQPYGGYLPISDFSIEKFEDSSELMEIECINPTLVGIVVDYLSRFMLGSPAKDAFAISLLGAKYAEKFGVHDARALSYVALRHIKDLSDDSIVNACKLVTYDGWYRNPMSMTQAKNEWDVNPDEATINNIRIMINRTLSFWKKTGPIVTDGFTFEGAYTDIIDSGDGDYLTYDGLWDMKVSKHPPKPTHTLQILIYWIMGLHTGREEFLRIKRIGIYNPRLNCSYIIDTDRIPNETRLFVEKDVIGY